MKLNYLEFLLVNNSIRAYVQEKYELPILMNMVASMPLILSWKSDVEMVIDTFFGFPGRLYRSLLTHPYEHMFSKDEIVQHIEEVGFQIDDIKKLNPLKMMPHFFLLASVP